MSNEGSMQLSLQEGGPGPKRVVLGGGTTKIDTSLAKVGVVAYKAFPPP